MTTTNLREQLHRQIDDLPDEVVEQIADFALFVMARRKLTSEYADWEDGQWQAFVLEQLLREDDEVEYSLEDAEEVFHP